MVIISNSKVNELKGMKNCLLLYENEIYVIDDFEIKKETISRGLFKKKEVEVNVLESIKLQSYNPHGRYLGTFNGQFPVHFVQYYNLIQLRKNWLELKDALKSMGFDIVKRDD